MSFRTELLIRRAGDAVQGGMSRCVMCSGRHGGWGDSICNQK